MQTALLLEDHEDTRKWLKELVEGAFRGIEVTAVSTLAAARKQIAGRRFNLAIVDISLPDGSGIDLIREIAQDSPETYCVVATIFDDDDHMFAALQAGAQGYLLKEQPKEQLRKRLEGILNGEPPLSPAVARRVLRHFRKIPAAAPPEVKLSDRETEVLTLIAKGMNRSDIARLLGISTNTAAGYIKTIYQKLNVSSRAEATLEASRLGLVNAGAPE